MAPVPQRFEEKKPFPLFLPFFQTCGLFSCFGVPLIKVLPVNKPVYRLDVFLSFHPEDQTGFSGVEVRASLPLPRRLSSLHDGDGCDVNPRLQFNVFISMFIFPFCCFILAVMGSLHSPVGLRKKNGRLLVLVP